MRTYLEERIESLETNVGDHEKSLGDLQAQILRIASYGPAIHALERQVTMLANNALPPAAPVHEIKSTPEPRYDPYGPKPKTRKAGGPLAPPADGPWPASPVYTGTLKIDPPQVVELGHIYTNLVSQRAYRALQIVELITDDNDWNCEKLVLYQNADYNTGIYAQRLSEFVTHFSPVEGLRTPVTAHGEDRSQERSSPHDHAGDGQAQHPISDAGSGP
jgi:hypothetical protein